MKIELLSSTKNQDINISDSAFGKDFNESLVHQAVVSFMAGARQGTSKQKTRSEVRGGGKKPFRQKGTGRARAGTSRSPLWRSGGKIFPASPQDFSQKMNRKAYRVAMRSILSELVRQDRLVVSDDFTVAEPKTKLLVKKMQDMNLKEVLFVTDQVDDNLVLASRNLYHVGIIEAEEINPLSLIGFNAVVMTPAAVKQIEDKLA